MNISSIAQSDCKPRKNLFIQYVNNFMSAPSSEEANEKMTRTNSIDPTNKPVKLGIENLQEFTIFPKEVVNGKTIITA